MFYAARNNALVGYDYQVIAFERKAQRDQFCDVTEFFAMTASELNKCFNCRGLEMARKYPSSVFNERGIIQGVALFNFDGTYSHMA